MMLWDFTVLVTALAGILAGKYINHKYNITRYLLVETLTVILFLIVLFKFGIGIPLIKYLLITYLLLMISLIDLKNFIIPNRLVLAGLITGIVFIPLTREYTFLSAFYGLASAIGFLLVIRIISRGGIGMGDIKLAAFVGIVLGWPLSLLAIIIAFCLAGLVGTFLIISRQRNLEDIIPFGPFLSAGTFISFIWGQDLYVFYAKIMWFLYK